MNGPAHKFIGGTVGVLAVYGIASQENRKPTLAETLGGVAGGIGGGKAPDLLEPATSPRHRKACHSGLALVGNVMVLNSQEMKDGINWFHAMAAEQRIKAQGDGNWDFLHLLLAWALEFFAGVMPAFPTGYASHLLADWTTPARIPLFC